MPGEMDQGTCRGQGQKCATPAFVCVGDTVAAWRGQEDSGPGEQQRAIAQNLLVHVFFFQIGSRVGRAGFELAMLLKMPLNLGSCLCLPKAVVAGTRTVFPWLLCEHLFSVTQFPSVESWNVMGWLLLPPLPKGAP